MFLPSHTRPFIRANPLEQAVSEEQKNIDGKSIKIRFLLFFYFLVSLFVFLDWPISQGSQGLPQAAPRVEQHSDFRVAPLMLTSQRLSCMVSQQVLFILSVESRKRQKKKKSFRKTLLSAVNVVTVSYGSFRILFGTTCIFRWRGAILTDSYWPLPLFDQH